jgi:hypothetical protein
MQLTFEGETLGEIIPKVRFFLDTVTTDEGRRNLADLHRDIPASEVVRSNPKPKHGEKPSPAAIAAAQDAEAPPCSREDVKSSLEAYVVRFGFEKAGLHAPSLMGAPVLTSIPAEKLWRAKAALDKAVALNKPAG